MDVSMQPAVRAQPGLSAAVGSALAWRRCVTGGVIAGIGQMSLLGNVDPMSACTTMAAALIFAKT